MDETNGRAADSKVTAGHLKRDAYLYIRQSSIRQVFENTESTKRQYALRQRAVALGWPEDRVVVVDCDQGQSGSSADRRKGFQSLVADVGLGKAGIVMGLEVSRLARKSSDWHRLLEICALSNTLILDEDGLYDPNQFNDRLVLGLKGTMSEAELHLLRARLRGGVLNKARRGELECVLPVGLVYDPKSRTILDPDQQVQEAIRFFFDTFRRTGSAMATTKAFKEKGLSFPRRIHQGINKGDLAWGPLIYARALQVVHNPRYAGAFAFGKTRTAMAADGTEVRRYLPRDQWQVLLPDAHPGYISWPEYEENLRRLAENAPLYGTDRKRTPAREGPALLQGIALCGICGNRMTVRYHSLKGRLVPDYSCQDESVHQCGSVCQRINGGPVDEAVGGLLLQTVSPMAMEVALAVQQEVQARIEEADRLRRKTVERAQYEADIARRRYMAVDPGNRMVADTLEAEWNAKLRDLAAAREEYDARRKSDLAGLDETSREKIRALATDFPRLWTDASTPDRERKRMVRLLIEDVTLIRSDKVTAHVRFKGGATRTLEIPLPKPAFEIIATPKEVVEQIELLLDKHTDREIALLLNQRGLRSGTGLTLSWRIIARIRTRRGIRSHYDRLRSLGMLSRREMAKKFHVSQYKVREWANRGLLKFQQYSAKRQRLYEDPGASLPTGCLQ